jgi:hypothetical protein
VQKLVAALVACVCISDALAALNAAPDPWAPVRFLIGDWDGAAEGQPGTGTVTRTYTSAMKDRYIHERNVSTYPPQERNPKGEVHEHWGFLSYDRIRKVLVLRQFHQEGFVNQYVLNAGASTPARLVFESERFENLDERFKAREIYEVLGPNEFTETFEIAEPGKPYVVYSKNHFHRRKN